MGGGGERLWKTKNGDVSRRERYTKKKCLKDIHFCNENCHLTGRANRPGVIYKMGTAGTGLMILCS